MPSEAKRAFLTSVHRSYGQRLRRFVSVRLRNAAAEAPDLVQEIYLRLLRVPDHETIRDPQAYLFAVAGRVLHQHARRQSTALPVDGLTDIETRSKGDLDPAAEVEAEQAFEELGRSLRKLSPNAYATLIWSRCDGLTLKQIADRLGVSRDQVKKYLARALLHVREGLKHMGRGTP